MFSKSKIRKLGKNIRESKTDLSKELLNKLQLYRISHKESISDTFNRLIAIKKQLKKKSILTFRIKRIETILDKFIYREKVMNLHQMWDIAGCRIICKGNQEVYRFKKEIEKHFTIRRCKDYIKEPKENGYKSIHIYVESKVDNKIIEIQIRNQIDHNWSTLVEISDLLFDSKLKEYNKNKELLRFHLLLSKTEKLTVIDKEEILTILNKYKYIEKLNEVFNRNYIKVRKQWLLINSNKGFNYFLIETFKNNSPIILAFNEYNEAEKQYFEKFKTKNDSNIVLTHLLNPSFEQINTAYSNYLLTTHSSLNKFIKFAESLILDSIKNNKYMEFFKHLHSYNKINIEIFTNSLQEARTQISLPKGTSKKTLANFNKKTIEWQLQFERKIRNYKSQNKKFRYEFNRNLPDDKIKMYILNFVLKYISWKQKRKVNNIIKKIS